MAPASARSKEAGRSQAAVRGPLLRIAVCLPGLVMAGSLVSLAYYCHALLAGAAEGRAIAVGGIGFWFAVGGFFVACLAAVLLHCVRLAARVAGPEYRLRRALQRIRTNDLGFRVALRRGDLLGGLARECNDLLDWLNANPPAGARTGGDVVEVEADTASRDAAPGQP